MRVIDITGVIKEGMWNYDAPFPRFSMKPLDKVPWVDAEVYCEVFEGIHSQTGTYLETPAHYFGNHHGELVADIPVERLFQLSCSVLKLEASDFTSSGPAQKIDVHQLEACLGSQNIEKGSAILIATGWGKHWMDSCYLEHSPYFTLEAMRWIIDQKPCLLGTDFPRWDNPARSEDFFKEFYEANILMLAPCVNLENIQSSKVKLTALPLRISGTSSVPCRAVVVEQEGMENGSN